MNFFLSIFPKDASASGFEVDKIFYLAFGLTSAAFVAVVVILLYFLIRYRSRKGHRAVYTKGDSRQAILVTFAFAIFVFVAIDINLAVHDHRAWETLFGPEAVGADPLRVEIMPEQFAWNIRYAGEDGKFKTEDDVVTINQLHIPVGRPVALQLQSKDVIHSFFIPNFRIKQDVLPGMVTMMAFRAKMAGAYDIACAEHCGLGHYRMRGVLTAESEEAFQAFLTTTKAQSTPNISWGWDWVRRR
jgi:cytochrome c oxidase subunit 2